MHWLPWLPAETAGRLETPRPVLPSLDSRPRPVPPPSGGRSTALSTPLLGNVWAMQINRKTVHSAPPQVPAGISSVGSPFPTLCHGRRLPLPEPEPPHASGPPGVSWNSGSQPFPHRAPCTDDTPATTTRAPGGLRLSTAFPITLESLHVMRN